MRGRVRLAIGLALSAGLLWLALRGVDWRESAAAFRGADLGLLLVALVAQASTFALGALRWRALYPGRPAPGLGRLTAALLAGQLVNLASPVRLGPLVRAYLAGDERAGRALALATVIGEKVIDLAVLAVGGLWLIALLPVPAWLRQAALAGGGAAALAVVVVVSVAGGRRWLLAAVARVSRPVAGLSEAALASLDVWRRPGRLAAVLLWTACIWGAAAGVNWLVLQALGLGGGVAAAAVLLVLLQLGVRVPGVPANLGIFESLCIFGLGWFGVEAGAALSYGLALHAVVLLPGLVGGALAVWRVTPGWGALREAVEVGG
jgi:glycosyltransferase 2 family protein